ncbi:hypothetical protein [Mycoplasma sp. CB776]
MAKPNVKVLISGLALTALATSIGTTTAVFWNSKNNNQSDYTKAKAEANLEADKLLDENKKSKYKQRINSATTIEEINTIKKEISIDLENELEVLKSQAKREIVKIIDETTKADLNNQLNNATSRDEINLIINKAKAKQQEELNEEKRKNHLRADKIQDNDIKTNLKSKVDSATTLEELNKVKQEIEKQLAKELAIAKKEAEAEIAKLTNETKKEELTNELISANTIDEVKVIKSKAINEQEKEQARIIVKNEINKLAEGEEKTNLLNIVNNYNSTLKEITEAKETAQNSLATSLNEARTSIIKLVGHSEYDFLNQQIETNKENQAELKKIINESNVKFNEKVQEVREVIDSIEGSEVEENSEFKAKKEELINKLSLAPNVTKLEEIKNEARETREKQKDRLIKSYKPKLLHLIYKNLREGSEAKNQFSNTVNSATTFDELKTISDKVNKIIEDLIQKARETILILEGDDYEIAKANEILDSKDTRGANFQEYVEDHIIKYAISYVESKRSDAIYEVEHVIFERRQYYLEALRSKETKTIAKINALKEQALEEARLENEKQQNNPS